MEAFELICDGKKCLDNKNVKLIILCFLYNLIFDYFIIFRKSGLLKKWIYILLIRVKEDVLI